MKCVKMEVAGTGTLLLEYQEESYICSVEYDIADYAKSASRYQLEALLQEIIQPKCINRQTWDSCLQVVCKALPDMAYNLFVKLACDWARKNNNGRAESAQKAVEAVKNRLDTFRKM